MARRCRPLEEHLGAVGFCSVMFPDSAEGLLAVGFYSGDDEQMLEMIYTKQEFNK